MVALPVPKAGGEMGGQPSPKSPVAKLQPENAHLHLGSPVIGQRRSGRKPAAQMGRPLGFQPKRGVGGVVLAPPLFRVLVTVRQPRRVPSSQKGKALPEIRRQPRAFKGNAHGIFLNSGPFPETEIHPQGFYRPKVDPGLPVIPPICADLVFPQIVVVGIKSPRKRDFSGDRQNAGIQIELGSIVHQIRDAKGHETRPEPGVARLKTNAP